MDPIRRLVVLLLLAAAARPMAAQSGPVWHHQLSAPVTNAGVLSNGSLAVLTDSGLSVLAPEDGRELWRRPRACCIHYTDYSRTAVVLDPETGSVVDTDHGSVLWDLRARVPIDTLGGLEFLPESNLLLVAGAVGDSGYRLAGASLDSGVVRWTQDTLFRRVAGLRKKRKDLSVAGWQWLLRDSDTTFVIYPTKGGPMRLDRRTGALYWRVDTLADVEPGYVKAGYAAMAVDTMAGVVLIPFEKRLMAVRAADGGRLWTTPEEFPSRLAQIEPTPRGYVVRGYWKGDKPGPGIKPFVDLLDPATGRSRWAKPVKDLDDATAMAVVGDTAWLASRRQLMAVALESGELRQRATFTLKHDELPAAMEAKDGAFILSSEHNLVSVTPAGEVRFEKYYPPPGSSLFSKLVSATLTVGLSTVASANGYTPLYLPGPKAVVDPRYARVLKARQYVHILTGAKDSTGAKGFSVVRLDKVTGAEVGRVWVNERSPDYRIDGAAGMLYLISDKQTIEGYRF